jgi:molybdopterin converting factor small subunit
MFKFITRTESVKIECLNVLLYGEPGIGKTSLSFTALKPLMLDFDSGLARAGFRMDAVTVEKWEDVDEIFKSPEFLEFMPRTLVSDTVGAMLDNYIADYVKRKDPINSRRGGELSLQGYGAIKNIFKQFTDRTKTMKISTVYIAHSTEQREGDNVKYVPRVTGGSYDLLRQSMDLVGYIESYQNKRVIRFNPTDRNIGKDCAGLGMVEIPDITKPEYKTFLADLISRTIDKMNAFSENQREFIKQLDDYRNDLSSLTELEPTNKQIAVLASFEDRLAARQMFEILREKAISLGFKYNKETKIFENGNA